MFSFTLFYEYSIKERLFEKWSEQIDNWHIHINGTDIYFCAWVRSGRQIGNVNINVNMPPFRTIMFLPDAAPLVNKELWPVDASNCCNARMLIGWAVAGVAAVKFAPW